MAYRFKRYDLPHYYSILKGERLPSYLVSKRCVLSESVTKELLSGGTVDYEKIEEISLRCLETACSHEENGESLLSLKTKILEQMLKECVFCERRCRTDRTRKKGSCGVTDKPRISSVFLHHGEEEELVPSLTVFYSGCNFRCTFCQNYDIARFPESGMFVEPERLASLIKDFEQRGALNVNFVGGDPTPAAHHVFETLSKSDFTIPVIWNSNMFMSEELQALLVGTVDLYLADFKYGNDACAKRLSGVDNYTQVVKRNLKTAFATADVIIRHLVLPGHLECCTRLIFEWLRDEKPDANLNVMFQYHPCAEAVYDKTLARRLSFEERLKVAEMVREFGFENARVG